MYRSLQWTPSSQLSSESLNQMVENDKENYINLNYAAGPIVAMATMTQRFESMPGKIPTRIPQLSIDAFRVPYSGWYKAHFSCPSARQEVVNNNPANLSAGSIILDGYYFLLTCRKSQRASANTTYDPITGASLFNVQEGADAANIGKIIARSSFVQSGISVPSAATGLIWLRKGEIFEWHVYTYVANNNYDLLGGDLRQYARIIVNDVQASDTRMGFGSPRTYSYNSSTAGTSNDGVTNKTVLTSLSTTSSNTARKTHLVIQYMGTGGLPDPKYFVNVENELNYENEPSVLEASYEV